MSVTSQVSVASPAVAAIVNPELSVFSIVVLGIIALASLIIEAIIQLKTHPKVETKE